MKNAVAAQPWYKSGPWPSRSATRAARAARLAARLGVEIGPREALELYWRAYQTAHPIEA
jgi:hypothetical protein